jgi:hypothetical protein
MISHAGKGINPETDTMHNVHMLLQVSSIEL